MVWGEVFKKFLAEHAEHAELAEQKRRGCPDSDLILTSIAISLSFLLRELRVLREIIL